MLIRHRGTFFFATLISIVTVLTPSSEAHARINKGQCIGCGCKYERVCDADLCWISCSCKMGPQDDCMSKKFSAYSGATISKAPGVTKYRVPAGSAPAKQ